MTFRGDGVNHQLTVKCKLCHSDEKRYPHIQSWSENDIGLFNKMLKNHSLVLDPTGSVTIKLNDYGVLYFVYLFTYLRSVFGSGPEILYTHREYTPYILSNWVSLHLGDQGRNGATDANRIGHTSLENILGKRASYYSRHSGISL